MTICMSVWVWIIIIIGVAIFSASLSALLVYRKTLKKVLYMFDSFEDGEMNFHFKETNKFNKTLNRLRVIYEKRKIANEQDSWTKLIRVLTHEIMNTLTPVVSLSDALQIELSDKERGGTIGEGLELISQSSRNIMEFVTTYRRVTGIAKPIRKPVDVRNLIEKIFKVNSGNLASCKVVFDFPDNPLSIQADAVQVSQVFQNLIKNSIEAETTLIEVTVKELKDSSLMVRYKNNGRPIPIEVKERIFIPFFTTKNTGSGIGLSVCRQIMRYHRGSIDLLHSNQDETVFELIFN